jgi:translation initiation factor 4E
MTHYLAETIMSSSLEESTSSFKSSPDLNDLKKNDVSVSNKLNDSWTLWAHLPHDIDWSVKSYKPILTFSSVEEAVALCETLPNKMIKNCMLFLMRTGIQPVWEDVKNRKGGCFSYKVNNKCVSEAWKNLSYSLIGETLTEDMGLLPQINGITISPKKSFCIIKIWTAGCNFQNPGVILKIPELTTHGCLFKKHMPEY